ncbi:MAG: hypothetical protein WBD40_08820 [Tepidisphaeraceae bacterium]
MTLTRDVVLAVIKTIEKKNPKSPEEFRSAIVNHVPSDDVSTVLNATVLDVLACLTIADMIEMIASE